MTNSEVMRKCLHRERGGERGRMCRCLQQSVFSEPDVDNGVHMTGWLAYTVQGEWDFGPLFAGLTMLWVDLCCKFVEFLCPFLSRSFSFFTSLMGLIALKINHVWRSYSTQLGNNLSLYSRYQYCVQRPDSKVRGLLLFTNTSCRCKMKG